MHIIEARTKQRQCYTLLLKDAPDDDLYTLCLATTYLFKCREFNPNLTSLMPHENFNSSSSNVLLLVCVLFQDEYNAVHGGKWTIHNMRVFLEGTRGKEVGQTEI